MVQQHVPVLELPETKLTNERRALAALEPEMATQSLLLAVGLFALSATVPNAVVKHP